MSLPGSNTRNAGRKRLALGGSLMLCQTLRQIFLAAIFCALALPALAQTPPAPSLAVSPITPPPLAREFRGVWVATVDNTDWPSKPGLSTAEQQAELLAIFDKAVAMHLNAIIFQVRPACDAFYQSPYEPWSVYLTGRQGQAPQPFYDPLTFAVTEAHKRGLELHAWFNPYRARHLSPKSPLAPNHIAHTHPSYVVPYGTELWLDPSVKAVQDYSLAVIWDVVRRYDIDAVHIDDYFYPYKEQDSKKRDISFPDEHSWHLYKADGGTRSRDDWRRDNVNQFIARLYTGIKQIKPWVKFGISPFGIYRPGQPAQIKGLDAYTELYADSRYWLKNGWLDYLAPQLYWRIEQKGQSYPVLLQWWASQNSKNRHLWPGLYTSRVGGTPDSWPSREVEYQVRTTRGTAGATGNIHFSMNSFTDNRGGIGDHLKQTVYQNIALVPATPWLEHSAPPGQPTITLTSNRTLALAATGTIPAWQWAVQSRVNGFWSTQILPGSVTILSEFAPMTDAIAVSAIDRCGIAGQCAVYTAPTTAAPVAYTGAGHTLNTRR